MFWLSIVGLVILIALLTYIAVISINYDVGKPVEPYSQERLQIANKIHTTPIDLVYTWVDGEDDERNLLRETVKSESRNEPAPKSDSICRFKNYDELRYSIRSVFMYAPWIRRIYIVASGKQVPPCLEMDNDRVRVVYEEDLREGGHENPVFNSHAIECVIHKIPDLAEDFIYACDDMQIGGPIDPWFFFKEQMNLYRMVGLQTCRAPEDTKVDAHFRAWANNNILLDEVCGKENRTYPCHQMTAMTKSAMIDAAKTFETEWNETSKRPFRDEKDVHPIGLAQYLAVYRGKAKWINNVSFFYAPVWDSVIANYFMFRAMATHRSSLKCLNDESTHTNPDVDKQVRDLLERMYPHTFPGEVPLSSDSVLVSRNTQSDNH